MLAADLIERLIDFAGGDAGGDRVLRDARRAMQEAIRLFPGLHRWTYAYTHGRLNLVEPLRDGTIQYVHSTRTLTLAGSTWPSWAANGRVRIGDVISKVESMTSATVLILDATVNPGDDVDALTEYVIYQDQYTLPADFLASDAAINQTWFGQLQYLNPQSYLVSARESEREGTPCYYTFLPDDHLAGRLALALTPFPDSASTLDYLYQRRLRAVRYDIVEAGRVSVANSGTTVTGVGTSFRSDMVGSYIRLSRNTVRPTGPDGINPTPFEVKVTAVASTTSLTIATAATEAFTSVAYVLSDILDVEDGSMATALCWQANAALANNTQMKNAGSIQAQAISNLLLAKEHDARNFALQTAGQGQYRRSSYYPTGPDE